eukprot:SAG31_NODE_2962_length_4846_cov_3.429956_8_plen_86_part_00
MPSDSAIGILFRVSEMLQQPHARNTRTHWYGGAAAEIFVMRTVVYVNLVLPGGMHMPHGPWRMGPAGAVDLRRVVHFYPDTILRL